MAASFIAAASQPIVVAAAEGQLEKVRSLLADRSADPIVGGGLALKEAVENGHLAVVEALLRDKLVNSAPETNDAFYVACTLGRAVMVDRLLASRGVDPNDDTYGDCLADAAAEGHGRVVARLLTDPRVDPTEREDPLELLVNAVRDGHVDVVDAFLNDGRLDPAEPGAETDLDETLIETATLEGHVDVVKRLLADPRVDPFCESRRSRWWCWLQPTATAQ